MNSSSTGLHEDFKKRQQTRGPKTRRTTIAHLKESFEHTKRKVRKNIRSNVKPWIVGEEYLVSKPDENFEHTYHLGWMGRIFVTFEDVNSSRIAGLINVLVIIVLIVSCVQYVLQSLPSIQTRPSSCPSPVCNDDLQLCPGRMICEPIPPRWFNALEAACVAVFTVDYLARVLTCSFTPAKICGVIPFSVAFADDVTVEDPEWELVQRYNDPDFEELWWVTIYRYCLQPLNIIDLVAIIPFYIELFANSGSSLSIIRILRLARVVRLVKSGKGRFNKGLRVLSNTIISSAPMNAFLLAVALIIFIICGAIGYLIEGGEFKVTSDYPDGIYMRPDLLGRHLEPTPFLSVLHGMYWSIVTSTTVGYGDFYPTTVGGRVFACACTFLGIVVIALPVTVLGNHFGKEYEREYISQANNKNQDSERLSSFGDGASVLLDGSGISPSSQIRKSVSLPTVGNAVRRHSGYANNLSNIFPTPKTQMGMSEVERAKATIIRLESMSFDLQQVVDNIKTELEKQQRIIIDDEGSRMIGRDNTFSASISMIEPIHEERDNDDDDEEGGRENCKMSEDRHQVALSPIENEQFSL